jgi:hypothetical protein
MDKTLLFKAAEAAQGITAAQTAIEDRKRAVEEAKTAVEAAKVDLGEAKSAYDAVIAEFVASGVPASKVKRNVEDFLRILGDLGFVENLSEETNAATEQKVPRRKKAEQSVASTETAETNAVHTAGPTTDEPADQKEAVAEVTVIVGDLPAADTTLEAPLVTIGDEKIITIDEAPAVSAAQEQPDQSSAVAIIENEVASEEDAAETAAESIPYVIDNSEAFTEILDLIETITSGEVESVSETLVTLLNAADWFSREWEKQPLDVQFYRDILNLEFVESALKEGMDDELRSALVAVQDAPESIRILEWFASALDYVENGAEARSYKDFNSAPSTKVAGEVEAVEPALEEPISGDENSSESLVSDDVTLVGETVDDIGEINFLEDAAALFAGATVETVTTEPPVPVQTDTKPAEARSFRPRFLGSKGGSLADIRS